MAAAAPTPSSTSIWAFDFDGVLVDSARETGMAGWKGCEALFGSAAPAEKVAELLEQFALVRPILETGWEAVLLVHLLHTGTLVEALLTHFQSSLKASTMVAVGKSQAEIMAAFKTARTMWIASDVEGWLGTNRFYTTAVQAVQSLVAASSDTVKVYIITTKAKEFAVKLLAACNIAVPEERVFGLGSGRKGAVLSQIIAEHTVNGGAVRCAFMEDRLDTLIEVKGQRATVGGDALALLLADWGYNTEAQRSVAVAEPFAVLTQGALAAAATEPDLFAATHANTLFIS